VSRIRLFLVDDHQLLLEGTRASLERYAELDVVGTAATGREALDEIARLRPEVVLLDVRLPDINGLEVARRVHEQWPQVRMIALSGYDDARYVKGLRRLGVAACLPKTLTTGQLVQAIQDVAAGNSPPHGGSDPPDEGALLDPLTPREMEVLQLMSTGSRNGDIAAALDVSVKAVEYHVGHILEKLDAKSRSEAIVKASRLLEPPAGEDA
jgi:DNA-binding NarL/FixJ family response regulator